MTKTFVDTLIHNMKQAGMISKALPWMVEGFGDKQLNTRYVGITIKDDWTEILSPQNNLLLKFLTGRNEAYLEFYLANKPPFVKIYATRFTEANKWEVLLGEFKRKLKKEKQEYMQHTDSIENIYTLIKPHLK